MIKNLAIGLLMAAISALSALPSSANTAEPPEGAPAPAATATTAVVTRTFTLPKIKGTTVSPNEPNWAGRTNTTGPLLLFLPATGSRPTDYTRFLTYAAQSGYHVLGLDYWNKGKAISSLCNTNADCYTEVEQNRLDGTDPSPFSSITAANSVKNRLRVALRHLDKVDPDGGWGRFMTGNHIHWRSIIAAGHSQGGGEAAYIAHKYRVVGQLTFSSPNLTDGSNRASWFGTPGKTPQSAMFGFNSSHDEYYTSTKASWDFLRLSGSYKRAIPYPAVANVHQLITLIKLGSAAQSHSRVVANDTPLQANGTPRFQPTWNWLLAQVCKHPYKKNGHAIETCPSAAQCYTVRPLPASESRYGACVDEWERP